jgi:hypothetical protein
MTFKRPLIIVTLVIGTLAVGAGGVAVLRPDLGLRAAEIVAQSAHGGGGHGRGLERLCSTQRDEKLENGLTFVESFVDFKPEQAQAWTELATALRAGSASIGQTCGELGSLTIPAHAPDKLALVETLLTKGVAVLGQVRPAFATFYETLDDDQKQAIDRLTSRRHGR